jgi:hypothetical protein
MRSMMRLPRDLVVMGIGLGFSIASSGCAFFVDFDYEEAGQGGGATSSGVSATGAGGGAAGCLAECGGCLASSLQGTGEGTCGTLETTPRVDAGYSLTPPEGILPPEIRDVVSGNGFVYLVGTFEQNLTTTSAGPINNQGYPEGLLSRLDPNAPTQAVAKRLVGCKNQLPNNDPQSYEPLVLAAAAWDGTRPPGELVVVGGFGSKELRLADLGSIDPCGAGSPLVASKDTYSGVAPFILRLDADLNSLGPSEFEVIHVESESNPAYFSAVTVIQGDPTGPPVVVALGVAAGTVTHYGDSSAGPAGTQASILGPEARPGYFLYAIDMEGRNANLLPLDGFSACPDVDGNNRYYGLDSAVTARSPWAGSPIVSVGYGLTNGGDECGGNGRGAALGGVGLQWDGAANVLRFNVAPPALILGGAQGSDASIRAMTLLPEPGLLAVAGTYRGRLGILGEPEGDASDDGFLAAFRPDLNAQQLDPRWVRRIEGDPGTTDGSRVEVGGLSAQLRMNGPTRLLVAATVPEGGVFGPLGSTSALPPPEWCLPGPGRRVLVASLDGATGEVVGANLLGDAADTSPWDLAASALESASDQAYVAMSGTGRVAVECTGGQAPASGFGSVHLRTLNFD